MSTKKSAEIDIAAVFKAALDEQDLASFELSDTDVSFDPQITTALNSKAVKDFRRLLLGLTFAGFALNEKEFTKLTIESAAKAMAPVLNTIRSTFASPRQAMFGLAALMLYIWDNELQPK